LIGDVTVTEIGTMPTMRDPYLRQLVSEWNAKPDEELLAIIVAGIAMAESARKADLKLPWQSSYQRDAAEYLLQRNFGTMHGWNVSDARFGPMLLIKCGVSGQASHQQTAHYHSLFDHPDCYRATHKRAAAIASHTYGANREQAIEFAKYTGIGLAMPMPDEFPSWYFPGATILKVWFGVLGRSTYRGDVIVEPDAEAYEKRLRARYPHVKETTIKSLARQYA
jgi:hypothetical protein